MSLSLAIRRGAFALARQAPGVASSAVLKGSSVSEPALVKPPVLVVARHFRASPVPRDWHQKRDPRTGEFYYYNIFSEEVSKVQPREYLPWDAPQESPLMRFFRTDTFADRKGRGPSIYYWAMFGGIIGCLMLWDYMHPPGETEEQKRLRLLTADDKAVAAETQRRLQEVRLKLRSEQK